MTQKETYERYSSLRKQGKTYQEIADVLGKTYDAVKSYCLYHGLGYSKEEHSKAIINRFKAKDNDFWVQKIKEHFGNDFELIGVGPLDKNADRKLICQCSICGTQKTIRAASLRKRKQGHCDVCKKRNKIIDNWLSLQKEYKKNKKEAHERCVNDQISFKYCSCGSLIFQNRSLCDSCRKARAKESKKKSRRRHDKKKELRRRMQMRDGDFTILLEDVFKRDNGVCWLCRELCEWNDYVMKDNAFIAGNKYPSIDHVVPLAKGGKHIWSNIRLAHRICNSIKSDK